MTPYKANMIGIFALWIVASIAEICGAVWLCARVWG